MKENNFENQSDFKIFLEREKTAVPCSEELKENIEPNVAFLYVDNNGATNIVFSDNEKNLYIVTPEKINSFLGEVSAVELDDLIMEKLKQANFETDFWDEEVKKILEQNY